MERSTRCGTITGNTGESDPPDLGKKRRRSYNALHPDSARRLPAPWPDFRTAIRVLLSGLPLLVACLVLLGWDPARAAEADPRQRLAQIEELDLVTAQCIALGSNPDITAAQERVAQARARLQQAMAAWWPSVDIGAGGTHQRLSDTNFAFNRRLAALGGQEPAQDAMHYRAGLQATWVLFDGLYRSFNRQRAQAAELAEEETLLDSRRLLAAAVAQAFLNAQLAQSNIDIARAGADFYEKQLQNARQRHKVGTGSRGDVLNIEVQLNSARATLLQHERELEAARCGLAALLGLDQALLPAALRLATLPDIPRQDLSPPADAQRLIAEAYGLRPDIRRLEQRLQEATALAGMARAPLYPQLRLVGALEGRREEGLPRDGADYGNSLGVQMSWNLYAGGADKARLVEAGHIQREAAYTLAALRNQIAADIRTALALRSEAEAQLRLQRRSVRLVEENRRLAENAYAEGEYALIQLNEAQRDQIAHASRLAQALVAYHSAQQRLLEVSGRILEPLEDRVHCLPKP